MYKGGRVAQDGHHTPVNTYIFDVGHPCYISQNMISADQYHVTILQAQVESSLRSHAFFKLTTDQVLVFDWIMGLLFMAFFVQFVIVQTHSRRPNNINPFTPKSALIDFTLFNTRRFYLSMGDPLGVKGLKNYLP